MSIGTQIVEQTLGLYNPPDPASVTAVTDYILKRTLRMTIGASGTAGASFETVPQGYQLVAARLINGTGAITASDTNFLTFTATRNDGAGGSPVTMLTAATKITAGTGNIAASTVVPLTIIVAASANVVPATSAVYLTAVASASGAAGTGGTAIELDFIPTGTT